MSVSKSKMQIENKKENNENLDVDVIEEKKEEFEKLIEGKEPAKIKENEEETLENNETIAVEENEVNNEIHINKKNNNFRILGNQTSC